MNKRVAEASSLRGFFQEQWEYLKLLIEDYQTRKQIFQKEKVALHDAIESIVESTDTRLRAVGSYQDSLRLSARGLLDHIEKLAIDIPPAKLVSRQTYNNDPLVKTLFTSPYQIQKLFSQNKTVRNFFENPDHKHLNEVFAILFLNRREKTILGAELQGEMIVKDVIQTAVIFSGHRLLSPSTTENSLRSAMKRILFETTVEYLRKILTDMRFARTEGEMLAGMIDPSRNLDNPSYYLEILTEQMSQPKRLISIQNSLLKVNAMGIKINEDSSIAANEMQLTEMTVGADQSQVMTLVRFPRDEIQAIENTHPLHL